MGNTHGTPHTHSPQTSHRECKRKVGQVVCVLFNGGSWFRNPPLAFLYTEENNSLPGTISTKTLTLLHCNGNSVYIFLFWELRSLSSNFQIHMSVSDLYIPRIGPHISSNRKGRPIVEIYNSLTDT
jgi:hypothetical protein